MCMFSFFFPSPFPPSNPPKYTDSFLEVFLFGGVAGRGMLGMLRFGLRLVFCNLMIIGPPLTHALKHINP